MLQTAMPERGLMGCGLRGEQEMSEALPKPPLPSKESATEQLLMGLRVTTVSM